MKVLFAVNNESTSESIVKKYQKEYKEIISYKNVYYFNAILKELQKDKTYDRIVIGEDLEQFTNSSYEQMDKFIFERLDSISDEASNTQGNDIPIILICADRRNKGEQILVKLFGIGVYNAIIGGDRSVEEVCRLIYKPRIKKEAKLYYRIDVDDVAYQSENENDVSEVEIQNILAHYKRLGRQEERYVESFDNIAEQYNDKQLRIICKFLPLNVKAVLEEQSPKYQKVMSFNTPVSNDIRKNDKQVKKEKGITGKMLTSDSRDILTKPVIIPSSIDANNVTRLTRSNPNPVPMPEPQVNVPMQNQVQNQTYNLNNTNDFDDLDDMFDDETINNIGQSQNQNVNIQNSIQNIEPEVEMPMQDISNAVQEPKRGRGRPRKNPLPDPNAIQAPKRGRGRPRKNPLPEEQDDLNLANNRNDILPGFDNDMEDMSSTFNNVQDNTLPGFDNFDDIENNSNNYRDTNSYNTLPGFDDVDEEDDDNDYMQPNNSINANNMYENNYSQSNNTYNNANDYNSGNGYNNSYDNYSNNSMNSYNNQNDYTNNNASMNATNYSQQNNMYNTSNDFTNGGMTPSYDNGNYITDSNVANLLTGDKKLITVVGTSKNGTSFVINNVAQQLSSMGINTAILDTTANRNSYYIYTKNEEDLRKVAVSSVEDLVNGVSNGIKVNANLTVYTSLPDQNNTIKNSGPILETLVKNHSVVLVDCDFETPQEYFQESQEIYLVQSMDVLTIQPLTAFLRDLKAKNILDERKIRIIINKFTRVRSVTEKTIIGGMAFYNDPAMSFMTELFDRNTAKYVILPFEEETYVRYLEGLVNCEITLKGYSKTFLQYLKQVANMMYPLISGKGAYRPNNTQQSYGSNNFSSSMNDTLNQMKRNY